MTKVIVVVTFLALCVIAIAYTDLDDSIDVDAKAKSKAVVKEYMDCYLDRTPCTPPQEKYKSHIKEAVSDGCKECNDIERHMLRVFIQAIKDKIPEDLEPFKAKYDPNGHIDTTFAQIKKY